MTFTDELLTLQRVVRGWATYDLTAKDVQVIEFHECFVCTHLIFEYDEGLAAKLLSWAHPYLDHFTVR